MTSTSKPLILAVCRDEQGLVRIERELRTRYEADYRVECARSAGRGLRVLEGCKATGAEAAVVLAEQRLEGTSGAQFLSRVRDIFPVAKRLLLAAPMDRDAGELLPQALTLGQIDYFEYIPGPPPNERFHQVITGFLSEWTRPGRSEVHATPSSLVLSWRTYSVSPGASMESGWRAHACKGKPVPAMAVAIGSP